MSKVILRPFNPDRDSGLIFDSYPKGVYHGSSMKITKPRHEWFKDFFQLVKDQIETADIIIACMQNAPDTVMGYSIIEEGIIQFIYVKEMFRNQGIAKMLYNNADLLYGWHEEHMTKVGRIILDKKNKEGQNGKETAEQDDREAD